MNSLAIDFLLQSLGQQIVQPGSLSERQPELAVRHDVAIQAVAAVLVVVAVLEKVGHGHQGPPALVTVRVCPLGLDSVIQLG